MKDGKVFIWMNLIGFNRDDPDKGAQRFLDQTGFIPDGAAALLCHPDFFHQHRGMEEEYILPPDNCAYWGIPRNAERERQEWSNYDLRQLAQELEAKGSGLYASIFGVAQNNAFHQEWIYDHPELQNHGKDGAENAFHLFVLKRFKDGTYYEDFFIDKLCQTLVDYGMKGVHLADIFCPPVGGMLHSFEYSTDFVDQFLTHTGLTLPEDVAATMGEDSKEAENKRAAWIYANLREEWAHFHAWRWESFFKKLCDRVHAIGKEVMVLGMFCTDPFETLYCIGIDLNKIVRAGVDYITANILPTSVFIADHGSEECYFHRYMAIASTTAAHLPKGHLVSMVGLQDATEEWSAMHDAQPMHERDLYTMMAYHMVDGDGTSRALEGYFLCLGDGISRSDWDWERERMEIAMSAKAKRVMSPSMLWSDYAFNAMLHEYIHTRRWTPFKLFYELGKAGANLAATVKPEGLKNFSGTLVVPNFDMLSEEEKKLVASYDKGAVLCTASPNFDPKAYGMEPSICFSDKFSDYPMTCFVFGTEISDEVKAQVAELISVDDGTPNLVGPVEHVKEFDYTLVDTLVFAKVNTGFRDAMALLLNEVNDIPFKIDKPNIVLQMPDGAYRLYLYNKHMNKYYRAFVESKNPIEDVKTISKFPILPPRYIERKETGLLHHSYTGDTGEKWSFEIKIKPSGVTIVDVYCKE